MSLRETVARLAGRRPAEPLPHLTADSLPPPPDIEPASDGPSAWAPSEHDAIASVAKSICGFHRGGPCPCRTEEGRRCHAPEIWRRKAGRIVLDLRLGGFLK